MHWKKCDHPVQQLMLGKKPWTLRQVPVLANEGLRIKLEFAEGG